MSRKRKLSTYTPEEIALLKQLAIKTASYGFGAKGAADMTGLTILQIEKLFEQDAVFEEEFNAAKINSVNTASAQMHDLAKKGSYQALAFLLSRAPESPYRDGANSIDPKQQDSLQFLISHIIENGGLMPPDPNRPRIELDPSIQQRVNDVIPARWKVSDSK